MSAFSPTAAATVPTASPPGGTMARWFVLAAVGTVIFAGAGWGTLMLWRIAGAGYYTALTIHETNAHGHVMIFGWLGLLLMGVAYALLPSLWRVRPVHARGMGVVLGAMVLGLLLRGVAMPFPEALGAVPAALVGGALQVGAVTLFAAQMWLTFGRSRAKLEPWAGFVLVAMGWFVVVGVASTWHTSAVMTASTRQDLLWQVATYQAPLRDMQFHGVVLLMLLGLSLRLLPLWYGTRRTPPRRAWIALAVLLVAIVAEIGLMLAYRWSHHRIYAVALLLPWIMLLTGVVMVAWPWRLWRRPRRRDASLKFVRAAWSWLGIGLVMLLLLPVHQALSNLAFSHAYYGAIRHAVAMGFASMLLVGMVSRMMAMMPTTDAQQEHRADAFGRLWVVFVLLNAGCALRVIMQTATDWHAGAFMLVPISGLLELAALSWWGVYLVRGMKIMPSVGARNIHRNLRPVDRPTPSPAMEAMEPMEGIER